MAWDLAACDGQAVVAGTSFGVPRSIFDQLFDYQKDCVQWMYSLTRFAPSSLAAKPRIQGGILADDMGLGKTTQTVAFVSALFHSDLVNAVLIVAPVSVVPVWEGEFKRWAPEIRVRIFHGGSKTDRAKAISAVVRRGGVLLTTYGMITNDTATLGGQIVPSSRSAGGDEEADECAEDGDGAAPSKKRTAATPAAAAAMLEGLDVRWDLLVLDEGHKIKNAATLVAKAVRTLAADMRLVLTGTPVQNSLEELWALVDFVSQGQLLGTRRDFTRGISDMIVRGRDRLATPFDKRAAAQAQDTLSALVRPFILRREKAAVFAASIAAASSSEEASAAAAADGELAGAEATGGPGGSGAVSSTCVPARPQPAAPRALAAKKEVVIWTKLSALQLHLYTQFLRSDGVKDVLNRSQSPLAAITVLKKIACHPLLLRQVADGSFGVADDASEEVAEASGGGAAGAVQCTRSKQGAPPVETAAQIAEASQQLYHLLPDVVRGNDVDWARSAPHSVDAEEVAVAAPASATQQRKAKAVNARLYLPAARHLVAASGKLQVFVQLVQLLMTAGNKVLVFSQSLSMLDMLELLLSGHVDDGADVADGACHGDAADAVLPRVQFVRIDGTVLDPSERRARVDSFNSDPRIAVCLLSTGVGALGLTLNGADRVIIMDPSWNPATEQQAVDRAYRIGQTKNVVTYRLVSAGTVEEKMYRLQVFKGGLSQSVMSSAVTRTGSGDIGGSGGEALRYLTRSDLKDLFTLGATTHSETQAMVDAIAPAPAVAAPDVAAHIAVLQHRPFADSCVGISHHDHLFNLDSDATLRLRLLSEAGGGKLVAAAISVAVASPVGVCVPEAVRSEVVDAVRSAEPAAAAAEEAAVPAPGSLRGADRVPAASGSPEEAVIDLTCLSATPPRSDTRFSHTPVTLCGNDEEDSGIVAAPPVDSSDRELSVSGDSPERDESVAQPSALPVPAASPTTPKTVGARTPDENANALGIPSLDADISTAFLRTPLQAVASENVVRRSLAPVLSATPSSSRDESTCDEGTCGERSARTDAISSSVCERHARLCAQAGLPPAAVAALSRCECCLSPDSRALAEYAREAVVAASSCLPVASIRAAATAQFNVEDVKSLLDTVLDALVVCDADPGLHFTAMRAALALGLLKPS